MWASETGGISSPERRAEARGKLKLALPCLLGIVLLIRLPFLTQAIQGDDPYYLFGAQHALIDPAHPTHAKYIFHGELVDMRGHPHPPLNSWLLAALIAIFGDVYEVPFHAVYGVFSLIAAAAMWSLARRWSPQPFLATLLFVAVPAFVINGNSLEADVPFVAWWMSGIALFVSGRFAFAAAALALAALTAYQAIAATPILWVWCWLRARHSKAAWAASVVPVVVFVVFQAYERLTGGALPAAVLAGYFSSYGLQQLSNKLKNAAALTAHTGWLVFPFAALMAFRRSWLTFVLAAAGGALIDSHPLFWASFAIGALVIADCARTAASGLRLSVAEPFFPAAWVIIFFLSALTLFFAGSARYLLPMAAPVIVLVSQKLDRRWLLGSAAANLVLGLCLAWVNWQHWDGYRAFVRSVPDAFGHTTFRTWINGELGIRFYAESEGALPIPRHQVLQTGEWVLSSDLGFPIPLTAPLSTIQEREIRPTLPLRLVGVHARAGYSSVSFGLRPFDISWAPVDRVRAQIVRQRNIKLSWLPMNAPDANEQLLSGIHQLEGTTRWMGGRAVLLLAIPSKPEPVEVQLYLPPAATARTIRISIDGNEVHREELPGPGLHDIRTKPVSGATLAVELDQTFRVPGDHRDLGAVLVAAGYR